MEPYGTIKEDTVPYVNVNDNDNVDENKRVTFEIYLWFLVSLYIYWKQQLMVITLQPELFQTDTFQKSFREKLKSSRYFDYHPPSLPKDVPLKHYDYVRAVKGVLAEFAFMGYLMIKDVNFIHNKKVDNRKYSPDIDVYIPATKTRIDVKSGFSFWKKQMLVKYNIDYVVVCSPRLHIGLNGVYSKGGWIFVSSYRQLFKNAMMVDLNGYISVDDILLQESTYKLEPIENLFK
jgi:hypothetical protein